MCHVVNEAGKSAPDQSMHTLNIGTRTTTSVDQIAEIVADVLGLDPTFEYTGGD